VVPGGGAIDQTATLQVAADQAAQSGIPFFLPPGVYSTGKLQLKSGTHLKGVPGKSILRYRDGGALLGIEAAKDVSLDGLVLDGDGKPLGDGGALLVAIQSERLGVKDCRVVNATEDGIVLRRVSGRIADCEIGDIRGSALFSEDAGGLEITGNHVRDCGDNGILVWRSTAGEDGTIVTGNRIERIAAKSGGSGQNGNGVNVFRAGSVLVSGNRIADCAFSAIRSNSGSNCQMLGNSCERLGEVALYAEPSSPTTSSTRPRPASPSPISTKAAGWQWCKATSSATCSSARMPTRAATASPWRQTPRSTATSSRMPPVSASSSAGCAICATSASPRT
jgi:uncharacterized secreted repeat protein (TIGR03808 family)